MKLGIALIPSERAIAEIIALQAIAERYEALAPRLGSTKNLPHVTLLQGEVDDSSATRGAYAAMLEETNAACPRDLSVRFTSVDYVERGWYFLSIERSPELAALQQAALGVLGPILKRPEVPESTVPDYYTESQRKNFLRFGYRYLGSDFAPHVTLGRASNRSGALIRTVAESCENFLFAGPQQIARITVYQMGENGSHASTLDARSL